MTKPINNNNIRVTITKDERRLNNWIHGKAEGGVTFSAKIFDNGSEYGINKGRVSKLDIRQGGKIVVNYDRGWDVKPKTPEIKAIYKSILTTLNTLGKEADIGKSKDFLAKIEDNKQKVNQSAPEKPDKAKGEELC